MLSAVFEAASSLEELKEKARGALTISEAVFSLVSKEKAGFVPFVDSSDTDAAFTGASIDEESGFPVNSIAGLSLKAGLPVSAADFSLDEPIEKAGLADPVSASAGFPTLNEKDGELTGLTPNEKADLLGPAVDMTAFGELKEADSVGADPSAWEEVSSVCPSHLLARASWCSRYAAANCKRVV